jgi:ABC-type transport system involved in multi-copper enzyme maturation permease subunit
MRNFVKLTGYTIVDLVHHKSFYVVLTISVLFVLLLKGCYKQDFTVNGQHIDATTVAWHASIITFHLIAAGALLIAALLSLGTIKRDQNDGGMMYVLSRPISRRTYLLAKLTGQWIVSFVFMFILHSTIVLIAFLNTGGTIPAYLTASLVCSLNVLFMVVVVSLFSLVLPDFASILLSFGIAAVSFASDGVYQIFAGTPVFNQPAAASIWRIIWPKAASLQFCAASLIDHSHFHFMGPLHPAVNIVLWTVILGSVLVWQFGREDI